MLGGAAWDQLQCRLEGVAMVCGRAAVVPQVTALSRAPHAMGIPGDGTTWQAALLDGWAVAETTWQVTTAGRSTNG